MCSTCSEPSYIPPPLKDWMVVLAPPGDSDQEKDTSRKVNDWLLILTHIVQHLGPDVAMFRSILLKSCYSRWLSLKWLGQWPHDSTSHDFTHGRAKYRLVIHQPSWLHTHRYMKYCNLVLSHDCSSLGLSTSFWIVLKKQGNNIIVLALQ
jgi:hypothetical protein